MNFLNIKTERLELIEIDKSGLQEMHEYSIKEDMYSFLEFLPHKTLADTEEYLQKLISRSELDTGHYWFIKKIEENKIIGTFGVTDIDWRKKIGEVSYGISPEFTRTGLFSEALNRVLHYLFKDLDFHRVCATTRFDNIGSIKGLQKQGFEVEGRLKDFYLSHNGKRSDALVLGILKKQFLSSGG